MSSFLFILPNVSLDSYHFTSWIIYASRTSINIWLEKFFSLDINLGELYKVDDFIYIMSFGSSEALGYVFYIDGRYRCGGDFSLVISHKVGFDVVDESEPCEESF